MHRQNLGFLELHLADYNSQVGTICYQL